jgi:hypothetical protein
MEAAHPARGLGVGSLGSCCCCAVSARGLGVGSHGLLLLLRQAHHQVPVAIDVVNPAHQKQNKSSR